MPSFRYRLLFLKDSFISAAWISMGFATDVFISRSSYCVMGRF